MTPQSIALLTRKLGDTDYDMVVGIRIGDQYIDLPAEGKVEVIHAVGSAPTIVRLDLYASTVTYEDDDRGTIG